jgi:hypothetical protein
MNTPWGKSQHCDRFLQGVSFFTTASHGGIFVSNKAAKRFNLSTAAIKHSIIKNAGYWFEEDCQYAVVALDLKLYEIASFGVTKEALRKTVSQWCADYLLELGLTPDFEEFEEYRKMKERDRMYSEKNPDLIVSALQMENPEEVKVWTADNKEHIVKTKAYEQLRASGDNLLLSRC